MSQIFTLFVSNGEKIPSNVKVVVRGQVKSENNSLPVIVRVSKRACLSSVLKEIRRDKGRVFCQ